MIVFIGCNSENEYIESISIEAYLDTTYATIGDVFQYTVSVKGLKDQKLAFSELKVENPVELREKIINIEENKIQFQLAVWDTGIFKLPIYTIDIFYPTDSTFNFSLDTEPLEITVLSILSGQKQYDLKPMKAPVPIVFLTPWDKIIKWIMFFICIVLLLYTWAKRNISHSFIPASYNNYISPFSKAVERLDKMTHNTDDKLFYVNLSYTLREFVENCLFIKSLEMTTEEIRSNQIKFPMDNLLFDQWVTLLSRADQIKYAKEETTRDERDEDMKWSKEFLSWARTNWELT